MHLVGVVMRLDARNRLDVQHLEAAAPAGVGDQCRILVVLLAPGWIASALVARCPGWHHDGELACERLHVAERGDAKAGLRSGQTPVGVMRMRTDVGGPLSFRLV